MKLRISLAALVLVIAAAATAWLLWPVQIMVMGYRLTHHVAPNHPVVWAQGPANPSSGQHPPNIVLIVADVVFYVLITPLWIGLRTLAWIAEFRAGRR